MSISIHIPSLRSGQNGGATEARVAATRRHRRPARKINAQSQSSALQFSIGLGLR
jgi:hypothetical protein